MSGASTDPRDGSPRRAVLAVALAAVMLGSVATAGVVLVQPASAAPETLSECTTIEESGTYVLDSDIDAGGETCFRIAASDVTLDGNGHTVTGDGGNERAFGVFVDGPNSSATNVTVTDLSVERWFVGFHVRGGTDVTISDTTAVDDMFYGYWVVTSEDVLVEDAHASDHTRGEGEGLSVIRSTDLVVDNLTAVDNEYGVHIDNEARDIRLVDSEISNNSIWGYYMRGYDDGSQPANVTATDLTLGDAVVDIEASQNVVLEGADSLPTSPDSGQVVGAPLRTSTAGGQAASALNLSVHYDDPSGVDESSLALWQYDNEAGEWSTSPAPNVVDTDANAVSSSVEFTTNNAIHLALVGENATDTDEPDEPDLPDPANFSVSDLDAPSTVTQGETATVTANVTNAGGSEATQTVEFRLDLNGDGTPEPVGVNESVTLGPDESGTVSFDVPTDDVDPGTYTHGVFTDNDSATAEITIEEPAPTASVAFENQTSNGTSVVVDSVTMSDGGFVTIHAADGSVVGVSGYLSAGTHEDLAVTLFDVPGAEFAENASLEENQTLVAMPHLDTNGNEAYDFVASGGDADGPYTDDSGAVVDDASITVESDEPEVTYYQVDFVAGEPMEELSADSLYAQEDRLVRFAHGDTSEGITDRGRAWATEEIRSSLDRAGVVKREGDTATLSFTVNESASNVQMSLVSYTKPTAGFSPETADQQELYSATTETFGPGDHTITVELPDSEAGESDEGDGEVTDVPAGAVPVALSA